MLKIFEGLVKKEEIVREDISSVKMLVPFQFDLKDGKCVDADVQELFDFLNQRQDVIVEEETEQEEVQAETEAVIEDVYSYQP